MKRKANYSPRKKDTLWLLLWITTWISMEGQTAMTNIYGRDHQSLNGKWEIIIDAASEGTGRRIYLNKKPQENTEFVEYSFEGGARLNVPGDFNSQLLELKYYEGSIWYKKEVELDKDAEKRYFIYFGGANYLTEVYLNGELLGSHEGGFTPFQFEITDHVKQGNNFFIVHVNNSRKEDGIPSLRYDWWNYGGITRDVMLVETPETYIQDYTIQFAGKNRKEIEVSVQLTGSRLAGNNIRVLIPEAKIEQVLTTDATGKATTSFKATLQPWSPALPKLYDVVISSSYETIKERIGFRTIKVEGSAILLNGEPIFLKGINIHEEIPMRGGRAYSEADAAMLLREARKLGCNFIRFAHVSPFEKMVRMAEEMGIMIWEEIPAWQRIAFDNPKTVTTGEKMIREMIARDKNRCAVILWSVANETRQDGIGRTEALINYVSLARSIDPTRLITAAFNNTYYNASTGTLTLNDPVADILDVVSINKYFGWYNSWPISPGQLKVEIATDRPLIYSEFGSEALYGNDGNAEVAHSWGELHQEKLYRDHIQLFERIPNLQGTCPWVLYDFRSPSRMHQLYQNEWNRKGLISDQGFYKKAWYVMKQYYEEK